MPKLIVVRPTGDETVIEAKTGQSAMQAMTQNGIYELVSYCGGACSCGGCMIRIDADYVGRLPAASKQEQDFLTSMDGEVNVRLSCQIPMTDSLDQMRVTVVPSE